MSPGKRWLPAVLLVSAAALFCGCRSRASSAQKGAVNASWATENAWKDDRGEVQCPVCGSEVGSAEATCGHETFGGRDYYFCCVECQHSFHDEPAKFASGQALKRPGVDCPSPSGDTSSGVCQ